MSKYKKAFSKGYTPNWSTEIYTDSKVLNAIPITYQLNDSTNNVILECFYEQELKNLIFQTPFLLIVLLKKKNIYIFQMVRL